MNIELYIDRQLADTGSPESLGVTLKRQLLNPAEMNTKDAQKSYTITLPATDTNNRIFGMLNVEERQGKFVRLYDAVLVAGGTVVLEGKFRLSEITAGAYKGNLGVPKLQTPKDIFGDTVMSRAGGKWLMNMRDFIASAEEQNFLNDPDAFFPLVFYSLPSKQRQVDAAGNTLNRYYPFTQLDTTNRLRKEDIPPSVNCLKAIRRIFNAKDYEIDGSAFADDRLRGLYMSYHNPEDFSQPWGDIDRVYVSGRWRNYDPDKSQGERIEKMSFDPDKRRGSGIANILGGTLTTLTEEIDRGGNIIPIDNRGKYIRINSDGYYKIRLRASVRLDMETPIKYYNNNNGDIELSTVQYVENGRRIVKPNNAINLSTVQTEIKVLRERADDTDDEEKKLDMSKVYIDKNFYRNNLDQVYDQNKPEAEQDKTQRFPVPERTMFVDQMHNPHFVCGLAWGETREPTHHSDQEGRHHPLDTYGNFAQALAVKGGLSWNSRDGEEDLDEILSAVYCRGYTDRYGNQPETQTYRVEPVNAPEPWCRRHTDNLYTGSGEIVQMIRLEEGDRLFLVSYTLERAYSSDSSHKNGWVMQQVEFELDVQPFKLDDSDGAEPFIRYGEDGDTLVSPTDFEDPSDFTPGTIDLFHFLPSHVKVTDWLDQFCRTFNLTLGQTGDKRFRLDVNQQEHRPGALPALDLDGRASVARRTNTPLGLPAGYRLRFTLNEDEEGYRLGKANGEDGSGEYRTGIPPEISTEWKEVESRFSYCWYRDDMTYKMHSVNESVPDENRLNWVGDTERSIDGGMPHIPLITSAEVWKGSTKKQGDMTTRYFPHYPQRFWYKKPFSQPSLENGRITGGWLSLPYGAEGKRIRLSLVANESQQGQRLALDYTDNPHSIRNAYYSLLAGADNCYTEVECYLSPEEYARLGDTTVRFNGDHYRVAEADGFDPLGRKPCTLRLIRLPA